MMASRVYGFYGSGRFNGSYSTHDIDTTDIVDTTDIIDIVDVADITMLIITMLNSFLIWWRFDLSAANIHDFFRY